MKESKTVTAATEKFDEPTAVEIREELNAKIPREAISEREGGGTKKLSYLEGWYVINRLNEVFGQGMWEYNTEEMRLVHSGEVNGKHVAHYIAKVNLSIRGLTNGQSYSNYASFSDFGYGDGSDKYNPGKAHELAVKEAVTDGIKRCAKNLGMSMGLALYDKKQENVDDGEPEPKAVAKSSKPAKAETVAPVEAKVQSVAAPQTTREQINSSISSVSRVLVSKKISTVPGIRNDMITRYNKSDKAELNDEQATEFLAFLRQTLDKEGK